MKRLVLLLFVPLLLVSCRVTPNKAKNIYLVTVADDFYGYNGSKRKLMNVINDQAALISELQTYGDLHVMAFLSQEGRRFVSETPKYHPMDKFGNELEDAASLDFRNFLFLPDSGDMEYDWTMKDVSLYLQSLPAGCDDLIIFTFSGHGEEKTGSLITNADPESLVYEAIGVTDLLDILESLGGTKVVFIDACYSGHFVEEGGVSSSDVFGEDQREWLKSSYWEAFKTALEKGKNKTRKDLWVMSASTSTQEASDASDYDDSPFQTYFGSFTYHLLKALGYNMELNHPARAKDTVSFHGIYHEIRNSFPQAELLLQTPQATLTSVDLVLLE